MEVMGLQLHVTYPTHKSDNILDLVFTELITQIHIKYMSRGSFLLNHCTVDFTTTIPQDKPKTNTITYRKLSNINPEDMMKDTDDMHDMIQEGDLSNMINSLESVLTEALDKHAPATIKIVTARKSNPWYTEEVRTQKRILRKMERVYCRYKTNTFWKNFRIQKQNIGICSKRSKQKQYQRKVQNAVMTPKTVQNCQ